MECLFCDKPISKGDTCADCLREENEYIDSLTERYELEMFGEL